MRRQFLWKVGSVTFSVTCPGLKRDKNPQQDVTYICCCFQKLVKLELKVERPVQGRSCNKLPGGA